MSNETEDTPFVSPQLDNFFNELGTSFITILSVFFILSSLFLAFFAAKPSNSKYTAFIAGLLLGSFLAAFILLNISNPTATSEYEDLEISDEAWVSIFFGSGLFVGLLCFCLVQIGKIVVAIACAALASTFVAQLGVFNEITLIIVVVILCAVSAVITYKFVDYLFAIFASLLAGTLITLGIGLLTGLDETISINEILTNPEGVDFDFEECGAACTVPIVIGVFTVVGSLAFNIFNVQKLLKKKEKMEKVKQEDQKLVEEMQAQRVAFQERIDQLENRNVEMLDKMEQLAEENQRVREQERQKELELQAEKEKVPEIEVTKEDIEAQAREFYELKSRAVELHNEVLAVGEAFVNKVKQEKSLTVNINESHFEKLSKDQYYQNLMKEEIELVNELKKKNEEFTKYKKLIQSGQNSRKKVLKTINKAYAAVEKRYKAISKLLNPKPKGKMKIVSISRASVRPITFETFQQVNLEIEELRIEIQNLEALLKGFEESGEEFDRLMEDLENTVEHFRENENEVLEILDRSILLAKQKKQEELEEKRRQEEEKRRKRELEILAQIEENAAEQQEEAVEGDVVVVVNGEHVRQSQRRRRDEPRVEYTFDELVDELFRWGRMKWRDWRR
eukprot:snap_masked-scaffold_31-processed-gene-1.35-mRNA-1 protein AED:1.00 eAED:1.00 QI:0/-1/0/0/-1/1/1/0/620